MKAKKRKLQFTIPILVAALLAALIVGVVLTKSHLVQSRSYWYRLPR